MTSRKSSGQVSTSAATKPPAKRSARSEKAKPTSARSKRQEREETLRKTKKRQARNLEAPSQLDDCGLIIDMSLLPQKRPAYPAHDDSPRKQRKVAGRPSWMEDSELEKPFSPSKPAVGTAPRDQDPVTAMGDFAKLPFEIRDEILRYLVLWPEDMVVFAGWELVYPRSRPRLDLSILYTCRVMRDQGLRILFGENVFHYDLRDPATSHEHTYPVLEKVFEKCKVPMKEYGHLIRHIKVKVDRNRFDLSHDRCFFEDAILKFLPGRGLSQAVNLHTVTLEVSAVAVRHLNSPSKTRGCDDVPICQYLRRGSRISNALLKLRVQWVRVLAWDRFQKRWETNVDMRHFVQYEQMKLEHNTLNNKCGTPDGDNDQSVLGDKVPAISSMEELSAQRARKAMAGLHSLDWRIQGLAVNPDRAIGQLGLWQPASPNMNGKYSFSRGLPSNFRDPSTPTLPRRRRRRNAGTRCRPDISPRRKNGPTTKAKPSQLKTIKMGVTMKEAALLEAQHDAHKKLAGPGEGGMLTEEWLENVAEYEVEDIRSSAHSSNEPETSIAKIEGTRVAGPVTPGLTVNTKE
ncbi:hypothetical protein F5Y14DRAFT_377432 [Nemania sp. NC0429]|nr:hypothetical protein F5Y14DRAFT_377432 [Nemania sp. NC0429]